MSCGAIDRFPDRFDEHRLIIGAATHAAIASLSAPLLAFSADDSGQGTGEIGPGN